MKLIVDSIATEYRDEGTGPALLLLHGWGNTLANFDGLADILKKNHRVVRLDLPGFGASEAPPRPWSVADYVQFVAHFCEKLALVDPILVGHSFGGRISIKGVGTGVLNAPKVVLIAAAGNAERTTMRNAIFFAIAKVGKIATFVLPRSVRERMRSRLYARAGSDYANAGALSETFLKTIRENLIPDAKRIVVPALLLWGTADATTPLADGLRLANAIPGSTMVTFDGAGHALHSERPGEVAAAIERFLI